MDCNFRCNANSLYLYTSNYVYRKYFRADNKSTNLRGRWKPASGDAGLVIKAYSRSASPHFYGWVGRLSSQHKCGRWQRRLELSEQFRMFRIVLSNFDAEIIRIDKLVKLYLIERTQVMWWMHRCKCKDQCIRRVVPIISFLFLYRIWKYLLQ